MARTGELEVSVSDEVGASADAVWQLVRDFGDIARWSPGIEKCELEGEGLGAVRTLAMGALTLQEKLEAFDDEARSFSYSIVEPTPLPLTGYLSTLQVTPLGDDRCRVDWSGRFTPAEGTPDDQVRGLITGVYSGGIKAIQKSLG
ncbi:MAG: SRPBCC family protein [Myxococcota bacterium]